MDAVRRCCGGLDVHQETVVACVLNGPLENKPQCVIRTFGTTTRELMELQDWLQEQGCKEVVMESTGVYWKPVWNILEGTCELVLVNARSVKSRSGKKTDKKDAERLAEMHRCGLIEPSMVPEQNIRDLRDLTRYRTKLVQAATSEKNRIHKILQDANIKLTTYMSDLFGVSGRALLQKIMAGEVLEEAELRSLVKTQLKKKVPQLLDALNGKLRRHHREMISEHWEHLMYLEEKIGRLEEKIEWRIGAYEEMIEQIDSIPGIERTSAITILAEMGPHVAEMFPTDAQFASWAGVSPGNNESAGKRKKTKALQGNKHLKRALCQAGWANYRSNNRIGRFFRRIRKRRGEQKASVATGHLMARILHAMMREKTLYKEIDVPLGEGTSEQRKLESYLTYIRQMGYKVSLQPVSE
ncbi:IS110 family RNA-guided transposase [Cohnella fermenti]|uniref:IS110 family transposase n=1 Tax=Cohnella fermenti TaxID=2565925 RepID=A0A4S4BGC4_9BACL|nr:IS110 family transposase [Cohnella fermenti]THF73470.1 IS110 family transposase [Cohnella fermenti]